MSLPVLLVGSVPLADARAVFLASARALRPLLQRYPDGETGVRKTWIGWQHAVFAALPELAPLAAKERDYQLRPPFALKPDAALATVRFPELGFAREAIASYGVFAALKRDRTIPAEARFQVALPTPWAPVYSFVSYRWQSAMLPLYEAAMLKELAAIVAAIPHRELAIQWDVATEMSWWERVYPAPFDAVEDGIIAALARLGQAVPEPVELAYHLCYGSMNNRHWKEPADLANLVAVANRIVAAVSRPIAWFHMPVPQDRADDGYFVPLDELRIAADTTLFLGLVHLDDGLSGALRRIAAARPHRARFGIATECGLGRRDPATIPDWLALHAEIAAAA